MKYLVLLKAINVAGKNLVSMSQLRDHLQQLQFSNVQTFIQSGNIVFESAQRDIGAITKTIEQLLFKSFQVSTTVFIFTQNQFDEIIRSNPFSIDAEHTVEHLHLTMMQHEPDKELITNLLLGEAGNDEYVIKGKCIYLHCPAGYGNTKLSNQVFERKLKIAATTRNWKTVLKLQELMKTDK